MRRSERAPAEVWTVCLTAAMAVWLHGRPLWAEETFAERRARIESMDAAGKEKLRKAQERFEALDPAEQKRLRDLSKDIQTHADRDKLLAVMDQYCEWVNTLTVYERDALRDLEPAERIEKIKELRERRRAWGGGRGRLGGERLWRLATKEEAALGRWIDRYAAANMPKLLEALPEPQKEELLAELKRGEHDPDSRYKLFARLWMRWQLANPGKAMPVDESALEQLRSELSPETREWLDKIPPESRQWRVRSLIGTFVFLHSQEELTEHFQKELSPEERDRLTNLPAEQARQQLWWLYVGSKWPGALPPFSGHRRPGWGPGGPLGGPAGGPPRPKEFEPGPPPRRPPMNGPREGPDRPGPP